MIMKGSTMTQIVQNTLTDKQNQKSSLFNFLKKSPYSSSFHTNTSTLLKTAYDMLETAERDLRAKDKRIASLENMLTTDELTKLTNRRGFYKAFEGELERTNRGHNQGGILIMIDLDDFKYINDTFGHQAGDKALKIVGDFLNDTIRCMDIASRIGGDEFIILFSNTSISMAMDRARKLGQSLNALTFDWKGTKIRIKASLGLKEYKKGDTIETIVEAADKGMYEQKETKKQMAH